MWENCVHSHYHHHRNYLAFIPISIITHGDDDVCLIHLLMCSLKKICKLSKNLTFWCCHHLFYCLIHLPLFFFYHFNELYILMFLPYGIEEKKKLKLNHIDLILKIKYVDVDVYLSVKHIINIRQWPLTVMHTCKSSTYPCNTCIGSIATYMSNESRREE